MLIHEAFGYDRFGLRHISKEEKEARRKFILSFDFFSKEQDAHKSLESYQDGNKSLQALVAERYHDEENQLKKKYQDFFKFPLSRQFREYQQKKQQKDEDYQEQKKWLDFYDTCDQDASRISLHMVQNAGIGTLLASVGTLFVCSKLPLTPIVASLYYLGAVSQFYAMYHGWTTLKDIMKAKGRVKMVLEDWHKSDPLARCERSFLNDELQLLDKGKSTQIRQDKKRRLVAQYRLEHPKSNCRS